MKLSDLSAEQKLELKQNLLEKKNEAKGEGTSYGELADADLSYTQSYRRNKPYPSLKD
mgnify:CR=1 FL=1